MTIRPFVLGLLTAGLCLAADPALLNLVMQDAKVVAGVDVQRARNSPLGQKIVAGIKEDEPEFQKLLSSTGFDPRRDLREVVMASDLANAKDRVLIIVGGTFDTGRISRFLQVEGGTSTSYRGFDLWTGQSRSAEHHDGTIAFLTGTTALLGNDELVRAAIDRHTGQAQAKLNPEVAAKVQEWSSRNDAWFVSTAKLTGPTSMNPGRGSSVVPNIVPLESVEKAYAGVRFGANIDISGETLMRSEQDATALADVIRFVVSMVRLNQDKPGMEDVAKLVDSVQVSTAGATTRFSMTLPEEQIQKLMESKPKVRAREKGKAEVI